ncbi:MAG: hypothetical protein RLO81_08005 [Fulvivirga sp.]|uniref:hypothetical protein n=1 Tax=Fulvivirga sp. TaxID=1931237 RepID=UPI0032EE4DEF
MASIVGISSNPEKSRLLWQTKVSDMHDWLVVSHFPLQQLAIINGLSYADAHNADFKIETGDPGSMWYVYRFDYITYKSKIIKPHAK